MLNSLYLFLSTKNGLLPYLSTDDAKDFPVFLRLGSLEIKWYAICILTGFVLSLMWAKRRLVQRNIPKDYYDDFFLWLIPIAIVGARLWYVLAEWNKEFAGRDFINVFKVWEGGLAIQGGVIFGVAWAFYYFKFVKNRYPIALHFDICAPAVFIGQIIGRWGNFFNAEVYGKLVERKSLWWIPDFAINFCTGVGRYSQIGESMVHIPLFYVEGLLNLVGFILIAIVAYRFWKTRKPFQLCALYFVWYGIIRFILEPLRDPKYIMGNASFGSSQIMALVFVVAGIALIVVTQIIYKKVPFEKIYINEKNEAIERELEELHQKELQAKIDAKKAEIRARKAKGKDNG